MIKLSELNIYPIKSTAQISLPRAHISPFGLHMDRRWMLIDEKGYMLTQRTYPRMCLIETQLDGTQLIIKAVGMPQISVSIESSHTQVKATVWEDSCDAFDCGDDTAKWFSDFLNTPTRLVYFPEDGSRQVDLNFANTGDITAFSDGFPYLLIGQASLDDLCSRLDAPISMSRFRPNLVVTGADAFAEDDWKKIKIGEVVFNLVKPCSRCIIPSIDPKTAEKNANVIKTLASYRMRENKILFGQNLTAEGSGELRLEMPVEILE